MSRTVIGFALLTIVCATVFAQGLAQSDIGNNLQGKYISEDGKYELSNIPAGTYTITFDKDNLPPKYRTVAQSQIRVDVRSGRNALDFSLE